jgi:SAM-dependent methyltransferase
MARPHDFGRDGYRKLIDWGPRIQREAPFLESVLGDRERVLDLGCGTGEHARWLASTGREAVGVDFSDAQIERAREYEGEYGSKGPRFLVADLLDLPGLFDRPFDAALCIGNVLPSIEDEELAPRLRAVAACLETGAPLVLQLLNYHRIGRRVRSLPVNVRPDPDEPGREIAWVRLFAPADDDDHLLFHPITLSYAPGEEPPVEVRRAPEIRIRAWTHESLLPELESAGFHGPVRHGGMDRSAYDEEESHDLVIVARRSDD